MTNMPNAGSAQEGSKTLPRARFPYCGCPATVSAIKDYVVSTCVSFARSADDNLTNTKSLQNRLGISWGDVNVIHFWRSVPRESNAVRRWLEPCQSRP